MQALQGSASCWCAPLQAASWLGHPWQQPAAATHVPLMFLEARNTPLDANTASESTACQHAVNCSLLCQA